MQRLSLKALTCHSGIREGCAGIAAKTTCCSGWGRCTLGTQGMLQLIVWEIRILLFIGTWSCPLTCQIYTEFCRILHNTRGTCFDKERSLSPQNGYQGRKGIKTTVVLWRSARKTDNDSTARFSGLRHALQSPIKNKDRQETSRSKNVSSMRGSKDLGQENTSQQYIHSETDRCPSFLFPYVFFSRSFDLPPTSSCDGVTSTGYTVISLHQTQKGAWRQRKRCRQDEIVDMRLRLQSCAEYTRQSMHGLTRRKWLVMQGGYFF